MATHDYVIANGTGAAVRADLNNALAAIVSNNSGTSEPATTYAYQWWADTTNNLLKLRNSANNAWITLRELDGTLLMEDGSASTPGLSFASDTNTGFFSGGADKIGFATGGAERLEIGSSEVVFNDPSNDVDFRVESNGQTHMLFVDAGNDRVGIGTSSPDSLLDVENSSGAAEIQIKSLNASDCTLAFGDNADTDVGRIRYAHSADAMLFFTAANERARLDSSGRLLVGTTASSAAASIIAEGNSSNAAGAGVIYLNRGTGSMSAGLEMGFIRFGDQDENTGALIESEAAGTWASNDYPGRLIFSTTASGASSPSERLRIDSSGNLNLVSSSSSLTDLNFTDSLLNVFARVEGGKSGSGVGDLRFHTYSGGLSERMRITSDGLVGIGSSSPNATLEVSSAGTCTLNLVSDNDNSGTNNDSVINFRVDANNNTPVAALGYDQSEGNFMIKTNDTRALRIDSSQRVMIGTLTEGEASADNLTIKDSGNCGMTIRSGTNNVGSIYFSDATSGAGEYDGYIAYNQPNRFMQFATGQAERARIDSSGRLLVGTTTVNSSTALGEFYKTSGDINLNVQSDSLASGQAAYLNVNAKKSGGSTSINASLGIYKHSGIDDVSSYLNLSNQNNRFMWNDTSGNFRTSTNAAHIGTTSGTVVGTQTSDERLKNVGADVAYGLTEVKQLQTKQYALRTDPNTNKLGFIAQQVESIIPEAVFDTDEELDGHEDGDRTKLGMEYVQLIPVLVNAIKELSAEVDTLKTKVAALEAG